MSYELEMDIFAEGTWNGYYFSIDDLNSIVANFNKFKDVLQVPLKRGHSEMEVGDPALGWVDDVWLDESIVKAMVRDIPEIVYEAINKKLYRNVSIELDVDVMYKGNYYDIVLSGVALLGAELPAVNSIADLTTYMSRNLHGENVLKFTAITTEAEMPKSVEDLLEEISKLKAENESKDLKFNAEKELIQKSLEEMKIKEEIRLKEEERLFFDNSRENLSISLDNLVKSGAIAPHYRDKVLSEYKEDKAVIDKLNFAVSALEELHDKSHNLPNKKQSGWSCEAGSPDSESPDDTLLFKIREYKADHPNMSFAFAREAVMRTNPDLAREYANQNGGDY